MARRKYIRCVLSKINPPGVMETRRVKYAVVNLHEPLDPRPQHLPVPQLGRPFGN